MNFITGVLQVSKYGWGTLTLIGFILLFGAPAGTNSIGIFYTGLFHLCLSSFALKKLEQKSERLTGRDKLVIAFLVLLAVSLMMNMFS